VGCSAPLTCDVTGCSTLDPRLILRTQTSLARGTTQMMILTGLLATAAVLLVTMLVGALYVLSILISG
jgi:hypothetical protein